MNCKGKIMYALGGDGGTLNFAITVVKGGEGAPTPVFSIFLPAVLDNMKTTENIMKWRKEVSLAQPNFNDTLLIFKENIRGIFTLYPNVDVTILERFQTRGNGGKTIEAISMMNAVIFSAATAYGSRARTVTAAEWKNAVNRIYSLEAIYEESGLTHHHVDSALMAAYSLGGLEWLRDQRNVFLSRLASAAKHPWKSDHADAPRAARTRKRPRKPPLPEIQPEIPPEPRPKTRP